MSPKLSIVSKNKTSLDWSNEQPGMTLNINKQNIIRVMKYTPTDLMMNCLSVNVLCCFMGYPSLIIHFKGNCNEKKARVDSGLHNKFLLFYYKISNHNRC